MSRSSWPRPHVVAGKDDMGGTAANRLTNQTGGVDGDTLGATGGDEEATAPLPAHTHGAGTLATGSAGAHTHDIPNGVAGNAGPRSAVEGYNAFGSSSFNIDTESAGAHVHPITGATASEGAGGTHNNVQPTIIALKIIKT